MTMCSVARLQIFILGMSEAEFRPCPRGTGLTTGMQARELGLVEGSGSHLLWKFRLTRRGVFYQRYLLATNLERETLPTRVLTSQSLH